MLESLYFFLGLALFLAAVSAESRWRNTRRRRDLSKASIELGLAYYPEGLDAVMPEISHFELFNLGSKKWRDVTHLLVLETEGYTIAIFDYSYSVGESVGGTQTVVAVQSPSLKMPQFQMRPTSLSVFTQLRITELFRHEIRLNSHPEFAGFFVLSAENEEAVRAFLNSRLVGLFEEFEGYQFEGGNHAVVFYRYQHLLQGNEVEDHLDKAKSIYQNIIDRQWA